MSAAPLRLGPTQSEAQLVAAVARCRKNAAIAAARRLYDEAEEHRRVAEQLEDLLSPGAQGLRRRP